MKFSMLENGVDSFKATYTSIDNINKVFHGNNHHYKDAILSINHAVEILFKYMLKEKLEILLFDDFKEYRAAKKSLKNTAKKDVFDINPRLKTVNLFEAMIRLEEICDVEIPEELKKIIFKLNTHRNKIMHYEFDIADENISEFKQLLIGCYEMCIDFFDLNIGGIKIKLDKARFEISNEEYEEIMNHISQTEIEEALQEEADDYDFHEMHSSRKKMINNEYD